MEKFKCTSCDYIYDPVKGDPDSGIEPGTPFGAIPDDWHCPVCGAAKSEFKPINAGASSEYIGKPPAKGTQSGRT